MLGRVAPFTKRELFKLGFCRRLITGGGGKQELAQGGDSNYGRRLGGVGRWEAMTVMGMLWNCGGPCGDGTQAINI